MKRWVAVAAVLASFAAYSTSASGQTDTTTTSEDPTTTTIDLSTTVPDTIPPDVTTTTEVELPGEHIEGGTLILGALFQNSPGADCQVDGSMVGQQMNLVRNETGFIGGVYGKAQLGSGDTGMVMVQVGPLPTAVLVYRTFGTCNQDVVALGGYSSNQTSAHFEGIGYGVYPGDFAKYVTADVQVTASGGEPNLDIQGAYDFLNQERTP